MPKTNKNEETTSELRYCPVCRTYRNWWEMIEDNKCIYCLTDEIIILADNLMFKLKRILDVAYKLKIK